MRKDLTPKWLNKKNENAMRKKRFSCARVRVSGNFEDFYHPRRIVKTLVRAAKSDEEIRVASVTLTVFL